MKTESEMIPLIREVIHNSGYDLIVEVLCVVLLCVVLLCTAMIDLDRSLFY